MSIISDMIRKTFGDGDEKRDAGLKTPECIIRYDNILYGTNKKWQVLDVYSPKVLMNKRKPVIVSVHGGGWVYGDKDRYQFYCMDLAKRGFAVVNFTYRLAPEYKYPAAIEDTNQVFHWVLAHADEFGMDINNIFAAGDSAGALNLSLYTAICTNPQYAKGYDFQTPEGFVPKAIALNCGQYAAELSPEPEDMTTRLLADLLPLKGTEEELLKISVVNHITSDYPPVFCMTSTGDFLMDQAPLLIDRLMNKKVPFLFRLYGDVNRKLPHVFHCDVKSEAAKVCNDEECDFFKRYITKAEKREV